TELAKAYYQTLAELAEHLHLDTGSVLSSLLKLPEVVAPSTEVLEEKEWEDFREILLNAIQHINAHRENEGAVLEKDLALRISNIQYLQKEVDGLEPLRQQKIREGLVKLLEEKVGKDKYDTNRLEKELIYYIEKI